LTAIAGVEMPLTVSPRAVPRELISVAWMVSTMAEAAAALAVATATVMMTLPLV